MPIERTAWLTAALMAIGAAASLLGPAPRGHGQTAPALSFTSQTYGAPTAFEPGATIVENLEYGTTEIDITVTDVEGGPFDVSVTGLPSTAPVTADTGATYPTRSIEIVWRPRSGVDLGKVHTVVVTATDPQGLSTTRSFKLAHAPGAVVMTRPGGYYSQAGYYLGLLGVTVPMVTSSYPNDYHIYGDYYARYGQYYHDLAWNVNFQSPADVPRALSVYKTLIYYQWVCNWYAMYFFAYGGYFPGDRTVYVAAESSYYAMSYGYADWITP